MDLEHVFVVFESPDGKDHWKPVPRENIPDWLRDKTIVDRMLAGEQVRNTADKEIRYYKTVEIERPRPVGFRDAQRSARLAAEGKSEGGIILPH